MREGGNLVERGAAGDGVAGSGFGIVFLVGGRLGGDFVEGSHVEVRRDRYM